jgi:hypothetical protein
VNKKRLFLLDYLRQFPRGWLGSYNQVLRTLHLALGSRLLRALPQLKYRQELAHQNLLPKLGGSEALLFDRLDQRRDVRYLLEH